MERRTRPRDRIARLVLVVALALVLGYAAIDAADALLVAAATLLALVAVWRVLACDILPLYHGPARHALIALGVLMTAPITVLTLLNISEHAVHLP